MATKKKEKPKTPAVEPVLEPEFTEAPIYEEAPRVEEAPEEVIEEAPVVVPPPVVPSEVELISLKVGEWFMFRGVKYRRGTSEGRFIIVIQPDSPEPRSVLSPNTMVKPVK